MNSGSSRIANLGEELNLSTLSKLIRIKLIICILSLLSWTPPPAEAVVPVGAIAVFKLLTLSTAQKAAVGTGMAYGGKALGIVLVAGGVQLGISYFGAKFTQPWLDANMIEYEPGVFTSGNHGKVFLFKGDGTTIYNRTNENYTHEGWYNHNNGNIYHWVGPKYPKSADPEYRHGLTHGSRVGVIASFADTGSNSNTQDLFHWGYAAGCAFPWQVVTGVYKIRRGNIMTWIGTETWLSNPVHAVNNRSEFDFYEGDIWKLHFESDENKALAVSQAVANNQIEGTFTATHAGLDAIDVPDIEITGITSQGWFIASKGGKEYALNGGSFEAVGSPVQNANWSAIAALPVKTGTVNEVEPNLFEFTETEAPQDPSDSTDPTDWTAAEELLKSIYDRQLWIHEAEVPAIESLKQKLDAINASVQGIVLLPGESGFPSEVSADIATAVEVLEGISTQIDSLELTMPETLTAELSVTDKEILTSVATSTADMADTVIDLLTATQSASDGIDNINNNLENFMDSTPIDPDMPVLDIDVDTTFYDIWEFNFDRIQATGWIPDFGDVPDGTDVLPTWDFKVPGFDFEFTIDLEDYRNIFNAIKAVVIAISGIIAFRKIF